MKNTRFNIPNIKKTVIDKDMVQNRNCENFIGAIQVPLGLAGPLTINNPSTALRAGQQSTINNFYIPLATTEGALVASVNRGCKATRLSGGVTTFVENIGATRGPLFRVKNLAQGRNLIEFTKRNFTKLGEIACQNEPFIKLLKIDSQLVGKNVWLRLYFETAEAMGMNMVTVASQRLADFIKQKLALNCLSLSGNYCVDKKASWLNFIQGRGKKVWAEAVIRKAIVKEVLKTSPEKIVQVVLKKSQLGSIISGSLGFNGHFANIVAAIFLATGQDLGHVVEGSLGITEAEVEANGDLYFSIYLPDLMVGTIGGGTGLPTQKEALGILGLDKVEPGDSLFMAQIIGAAVLAGELSLTASLAAGQLARAHQRLGRGINNQ